jgi:hypothetical protein
MAFLFPLFTVVLSLCVGQLGNIRGKPARWCGGQDRQALEQLLDSGARYSHEKTALRSR